MSVLSDTSGNMSCIRKERIQHGPPSSCLVLVSHHVKVVERNEHMSLREDLRVEM